MSARNKNKLSKNNNNPIQDQNNPTYVPPKNVCFGCQCRLRFTNGDPDKMVYNPSGVFDCICDKCDLCSRRYYYVKIEGTIDGGPCNCGNADYTYSR